MHIDNEIIGAFWNVPRLLKTAVAAGIAFEKGFHRAPFPGAPVQPSLEIAALGVGLWRAAAQERPSVAAVRRVELELVAVSVGPIDPNAVVSIRQIVFRVAVRVRATVQATLLRVASNAIATV